MLILWIPVSWQIVWYHSTTYVHGVCSLTDNNCILGNEFIDLLVQTNICLIMFMFVHEETFSSQNIYHLSSLRTKKKNLYQKTVPSKCLEFHSLPKDKFLDFSKLKAFADDKINVTQKLKFDWTG